MHCLICSSQYDLAGGLCVTRSLVSVSVVKGPPQHPLPPLRLCPEQEADTLSDWASLPLDSPKGVKGGCVAWRGDAELVEWMLGGAQSGQTRSHFRHQEMAPPARHKRPSRSTDTMSRRPISNGARGTRRG